ncbi:MAG: VWA domain-containing protein [Acidobacteriaceae bacterium]|nr:VWA domain-containing protein [Acidobacteriaceae bacterium]MBV9765371.1 VWA domain-containing protein [Acidobacteriaceae bacterium]
MNARLFASLALAAIPVLAQQTSIRTTVPLVVIPASVTDQNGHPIDGLSASDFLVLDDGQPRAVHVNTTEEALAPVSLVVAIQSSDISSAALSKIRKVGAVISQAVAGENGEAAVITFDNHVNIVRDFTKDPDAISDAFRDFKPADNSGGRMLDAVEKALEMLRNRPESRRENILIIGEMRDRSSESKLSDALIDTQRAGVTIYGLSYSAYLTPFTAKPGDYTPPNEGDMNLLAIFTESARLAKKNTLQALTTATGGRRLGFETQGKLENDLIALGNEIHNRYILTFSPDEEQRPAFRKLQVKIKDRPDVIVRARPGYWAGVPESQR